MQALLDKAVWLAAAPAAPQVSPRSPRSPATAAACPSGSRFLCSLSRVVVFVGCGFFFFFPSPSYSLPPSTNCPISVTFLRSFSRLYSRGRRRLGGTTCRAQRAEPGAAEQRGHSGHSPEPQPGTTGRALLDHGYLQGSGYPQTKQQKNKQKTRAILV